MFREENAFDNIFSKLGICTCYKNCAKNKETLFNNLADPNPWFLKPMRYF